MCHQRNLFLSNREDEGEDRLHFIEILDLFFKKFNTINKGDRYSNEKFIKHKIWNDMRIYSVLLVNI